jgi:hypothetical protein
VPLPELRVPATTGREVLPWVGVKQEGVLGVVTNGFNGRCSNGWRLAAMDDGGGE